MIRSDGKMVSLDKLAHTLPWLDKIIADKPPQNNYESDWNNDDYLPKNNRKSLGSSIAY